MRSDASNLHVTVKTLANDEKLSSLKLFMYLFFYFLYAWHAYRGFSSRQMIIKATARSTILSRGVSVLQSR